MANEALQKGIDCCEYDQLIGTRVRVVKSLDGKSAQAEKCFFLANVCKKYPMNDEETIDDALQRARADLPRIQKLALQRDPTYLLFKGILTGFERLEKRLEQMEERLDASISLLPPNEGGHNFRRAMLRFRRNAKSGLSYDSE